LPMPRTSSGQPSTRWTISMTSPPTISDFDWLKRSRIPALGRETLVWRKQILELEQTPP
jgi:hypothetical protein